MRPPPLTPPPLLSVRSLRKRFAGFVALDGVDFDVAPGERVGLIGPNGSGKSTFVNCISGALRHDDGAILFDGGEVGRLAPSRRAGLGLARSFQLPRPFGSLTLFENVRVPLVYAAEVRDGHRATDADVRERGLETLAFVELAHLADALPGSLTQVELRKLDLARAIAARPRLLVADESMAGLSQSEVDAILALLFRLNERGVAIIMIEHIMRAVTAFSQRLAVFVAGRKVADGDPGDVLRLPAVLGAYLGE